jgi:hypothetical protein
MRLLRVFNVNPRGLSLHHDSLFPKPVQASQPQLP